MALLKSKHHIKVVVLMVYSRCKEVLKSRLYNSTNWLDECQMEVLLREIKVSKFTIVIIYFSFVWYLIVNFLSCKFKLNLVGTYISYVQKYIINLQYKESKSFRFYIWAQKLIKNRENNVKFSFRKIQFYCYKNNENVYQYKMSLGKIYTSILFEKKKNNPMQ